ncbi:MAG: CsbD family protein [Stenotrophobium sp.]
MNQDTVKGKWHQIAGKVKAKWGKLTGDDMLRARGNTERLLGELHEQYGLAKEKAEKHLKDIGYI